MYFLNLSLLQFIAVFGSISAISVALYLLDRSRRRQVVSTLKFWVAAEHPAVAARRKHIQQPWSLILQLVSMALLLLAIAQLRLGTPARAGRDHVVILETSAWMSARTGTARSAKTLMDLARERALRYLHALPARDRVMLVRADALATPATAFEPDRRKVEAAIQASEPGATALNLDQALAFARHVQSQDSGRAGEIVFVGSGRTVERDPENAGAAPRNLRVLLVSDPIENTGLRKIGTRRSATEPDLWEIYISTHNYGTRPRDVNLAIDFGPLGTNGRIPAGSQRLNIPAGADKETSFEYRTGSAGLLRVNLTPHDAFPADDYAELELPAQPMLPVVVYTNEGDLLRPVLSATQRVAAVYRKPTEYQPNDKGLVILDRFVPPRRPAADSIWIDPPPKGSPVPVRTVVENEAFQGWDPTHPAAAGLRTKDFKLDRASVFEPAPTDGRIGVVQQGPVIVARPGQPKIVVLGFHPVLSGMRYELATPLLFANLLRWVSPEIFRHSEVAGGSVGSVKLVMDQDVPEKEIKVTAQDGSALPFSLHDRALSFFSGTPGAVRVSAGDREYLYSLTLPQLWDSKWDPPADAQKTIPRFAPVFDSASDLWPWLAVLGGAGLLAEWILFGRFRRYAVGRPVLLRRKAPAAMEARK
ncbi:MAG TPA: VWA domain-containing protein [Bryobacteraceae bacterium]|nr:VWA domain-containing protein [Bryobacteraceae bacterium]